MNKKINPHVLGALLIITDSFFFSLMTLFVRLSGDLPTVEKAFFRNAFAAVIAVAALMRSEEKFRIKKGSLPGLLLRAIFGGAGIITNFWAIDHLRIADANILNKMSPFFAIIMSVFILSEIPDKMEWLAVLIAFIGAAFVVKPTEGLSSFPALIGLLGGFCAGTAYTFVRKLGKQGERSSVIVCFFSVFMTVALIPPMIKSFVPMTPTQLACLVGAGLAAAGGQFTVTKAYQVAPAREISVFDYSQVLFASLWGMLFFAELPDVWSLLGYVIIIGTAVFKWRYTMKKAREEESIEQN